MPSPRICPMTTPPHRQSTTTPTELTSNDDGGTVRAPHVPLEEANMGRLRGLASASVVLALTLVVVAGAAGQAAPAGEVVMAWHVTISPSWFDPSTAPPQITPFGMLYALHDALVRP